MRTRNHLLVSCFGFGFAERLVGVVAAAVRLRAYAFDGCWCKESCAKVDERFYRRGASSLEMSVVAAAPKSSVSVVISVVNKRYTDSSGDGSFVGCLLYARVELSNAVLSDFVASPTPC